MAKIIKNESANENLPKVQHGSNERDEERV